MTSWAKKKMKMRAKNKKGFLVSLPGNTESVIVSWKGGLPRVSCLLSPEKVKISSMINDVDCGVEIDLPKIMYSLQIGSPQGERFNYGKNFVQGSHYIYELYSSMSSRRIRVRPFRILPKRISNNGIINNAVIDKASSPINISDIHKKLMEDPMLGEEAFQHPLDICRQRDHHHEYHFKKPFVKHRHRHETSHDLCECSKIPHLSDDNKKYLSRMEKYNIYRCDMCGQISGNNKKDMEAFVSRIKEKGQACYCCRFLCNDRVCRCECVCCKFNCDCACACDMNDVISDIIKDIKQSIDNTEWSHKTEVICGDSSSEFFSANIEKVSENKEYGRFCGVFISESEEINEKQEKIDEKKGLCIGLAFLDDADNFIVTLHKGEEFKIPINEVYC